MLHSLQRYFSLCCGNQIKKKKGNKKATFAAQETIKTKPTTLKMAANGDENGEEVRTKGLIGQITHQEEDFTHTPMRRRSV